MVLTLEAALVLDLGGHVSPVLDEVVGVDWGGEGRVVLTLEAALVLDLGGHVSPVFEEVVGVNRVRGGWYSRWRLLWSWILVATLAQCLKR